MLCTSTPSATDCLEVGQSPPEKTGRTVEDFTANNASGGGKKADH